jgi:glyoxylase-like metal-dependent hydrolase (beta-lactamase superfamily II)
MTSKFEVLAIRYGTVATSRSECYLRYFEYGEPDQPMRMDFFFWVLRGSEETIVVDSGFDPEVGARRGRTCLIPPELALAELGICPAEISRVLVTHLHYDHAGNLGLFPNAELLVHERELDFWGSPLAERAQFGAYVEPDEIGQVLRAESDGRLRRLDTETEVAPGVDSFLVGGHSPGQVILVVQTASGPVVLASDSIHFYEELERDWPFSVLVDLEDVYRAFDRLRELSSAPGARLLAGHDPAVLDRFPRAEGGAAEFAACLR